MQRGFYLFYFAFIGSCLIAASTAYGAAQLGSEPPQVVYTVVPKITPLIRMQRETGSVAAEVLINAQGNVVSTNFLNGPIFARQSVITAVRQWQFNTTNQADKIRSLVLDFNFRLIPRDALAEALEPVFKTPYALELRYKLSAREFVTPETYPDRYAITNRRCKVHGVHLRKDLVTMAYGLLGYNEKYEKARARLFPHEETWVGGGCVIETLELEYEGGFKETIGPPDYAEVEYCPHCRAAKKRWLQAHQNRSSMQAQKKSSAE